MKIDVYDHCKCGHIAALHENEQTMYTIDVVNQMPVEIVKVKVYTKCSSTVEKHHNGTYYSSCECLGFEMDNLRYLEEKSK